MSWDTVGIFGVEIVCAAWFFFLGYKQGRETEWKKNQRQKSKDSKEPTP